MKNGDLPATPLASSDHAYSFIENETRAKQVAGLTKREEFAARFMAARIGAVEFSSTNSSFCAKLAVMDADILLEYLEK